MEERMRLCPLVELCDECFAALKEQLYGEVSSLHIQLDRKETCKGFASGDQCERKAKHKVKVIVRLDWNFHAP